MDLSQAGDFSAFEKWIICIHVCVTRLPCCTVGKKMYWGKKKTTKKKKRKEKWIIWVNSILSGFWNLGEKMSRLRIKGKCEKKMSIQIQLPV